MNILIYGMGKSGKAAAKLFEGGNVYFYDDYIGDKGALSKSQAEEIAGKIDLMVVSPGISPDSALYRFYREKGVPIKGELEVAVAKSKAKIAAVTGTNGKTTVCQLIDKGLGQSGMSRVLAGNVGVPFSEYCAALAKDDIAVLEVSSFQLENFYGFSPFVSAVTNLTPDHLDRHKTMERYISAKRNIYRFQGEGQYTVFNGDDQNIRRYCKDVWSRVVYFGANRNFDCFAEDDKIYCGKNTIDISGVAQKTRGFVSNLMCAAAVLTVLGVKEENIGKAFAEFKRDRHRVEYVGSIAGVSFYDDSKATNIEAAADSVNFFPDACVIMGGSDKGYGFGEFFRTANPKYICAFGETKHMILSAAQSSGFYNIDTADDLEAATLNCYRQALVKGGTVILAPACASFDMFLNYAQRGERFIEIVKEIISKKRL